MVKFNGNLFSRINSKSKQVTTEALSADPLLLYPDVVSRLEQLGFDYQGDTEHVFKRSRYDTLLAIGYCFVFENVHQSFYVIFDDSNSISIANEFNAVKTTVTSQLVDSTEDLFIKLKELGFSSAEY